MAVPGVREELGTGPGAFALAVQDVRDGWARRAVWWTLSVGDVRRRYRRSLLGPTWITVQMAVFVAGIGVLYAALFGQSLSEYLPFVAVGFLVWILMSGMVVESPQAFAAHAGVIRSAPLPLSTFCYRLVAVHAWYFVHNAVPVALLLIALRVLPVPQSVVLVPVGFIVVGLNGFLLACWLGPLGARFRDIGPLVQSLMQLMLFLTPVMWNPAIVPGHAVVVWNPFAYFLEIIRQPLLGEPTSPLTWAVVGAITAANAAAAIAVFSRARARIVLWVG